MVLNYLNRKRILVTGGAGFLGSHLVEYLKEHAQESDVVVPIRSEYDLVQGDAVRRLLRDARPDVVIHLAAVVGGIGANRENPGKFFYENIMMGVQLIHESCLAGIEKFVAVGTICAYPKFATIPFREENLWDGYPEETNAPYGLAKKMLLVQSQAYRSQYGFNSIYLLPVNLYGPRDNFDHSSSHVIPAMIRKFLEAKHRNDSTVVLWGDGSSTREFLFVNDAAEGIVLAAETYNGSEPVNLGSGHEISIKDLAMKISSMVGFGGDIIWDTTKPNGQPRRCLDVSRAKTMFNFTAKTTFDDGLRRTIEWYIRENDDKIEHYI
ncbi:GDP-L-fucose synthase [Candidatus Woesearchaeota archaeon]|nr:GDP-L-fucose synthase [Candidatus Woesearchaeota archaeon]